MLLYMESTEQQGLRMGRKRSIQEKWSTSKGGPAFSRLFRLDQAIPFSFRPTFSEILTQWIATWKKTAVDNDLNTAMVRTVERNREIAIPVVDQLRMLLEMVTLRNVFVTPEPRSNDPIKTLNN